MTENSCLVQGSQYRSNYQFMHHLKVTWRGGEKILSLIIMAHSNCIGKSEWDVGGGGYFQFPPWGRYECFLECPTLMLWF